MLAGIAMLLRPEDYTYRFKYGPNDQLYIDHRGRRVVADVEGAGQVINLTPGVSIEVEGDDYGLVTAPQGVPLDIVVTSLTEQLVPTAQATNFEGAGWLTPTQAPVTIDGVFRQNSIAVPIPFFQSIETTQPATLAADPTLKTIEIDHWNIDDQAALQARSFKVQNISKLVNVSGTTVASHLNAATWTINLPENTVGLRLRKTYDKFHGRQRARVLLNGEPLGIWFAPHEDRTNRIATTEIGFSTSGQKDAAEITIDPPAGSPLWSVSEMTVFAIIRS